MNRDVNNTPSLDQQILLNEIHKGLALDGATFFMEESIKRCNSNLVIPKSNLFIVAHALIAYLYWTDSLQKNRIDSINESILDISESIDCMSSKPDNEFWMKSDIAAIDKAKEIGLEILPEWSVHDLRYKLHQRINGGVNG